MDPTTDPNMSPHYGQLTDDRANRAAGENGGEDVGELVEIGEAAAKFKLAVSTLRYWESRGLLRPARRRGGRRRYGAAELRRIALIQLWQDAALMSLDEIAVVLAGSADQRLCSSPDETGSVVSAGGATDKPADGTTDLGTDSGAGAGTDSRADSAHWRRIVLARIDELDRHTCRLTAARAQLTHLLTCSEPVPIGDCADVRAIGAETSSG